MDGADEDFVVGGDSPPSPPPHSGYCGSDVGSH